jgi:glycosyltransferase involved in cell wall biosynthesis
MNIMVSVLFILGINQYTGLSTWSYELVKGLEEFDIDIYFHSKNPKFISNDEYVKDISLYANVISELDSTKKYDITFIHNTSQEEMAKKVSNKTIFVSHSSMTDSAVPKLKHDKHITISGQSKWYLGADMFIPNGIDLNKFKSDFNTDELLQRWVPERALYHSRTRPQNFVFDAFDELHIKLDYWDKIEKDVTKKIKEADFVIGYGRSAYEAMAMGKPVLIFGHNSPDDATEKVLRKSGISYSPTGGLSDGWVDENNFKELLHRNCCGWVKQIYINNKKDMQRMIKGYDYKMGNVNRLLAEKYLSSVSMVDSFKKVIYEIT